MSEISTHDNLELAARLARRRKSRRPDVEAWWLTREGRIAHLSAELLSGTWRPSGYRMFWIREPKRREIAAAPFEDRVVHHALCNRMQPLLENRFIDRSFSCRIGKGTLAARDTCRALTNRYRYVLKCDVRKFFHSIDHRILQEKLAAEIQCRGVFDLCRLIIGSFETGDTIEISLFQGDDFLEAANRPRGLPIGNLTSQLWGNFYLDRLDHVITEQEQHGAYIRYTDDFMLFGNDKNRLWELHAIIIEELANIRLKLSIPKSRLLQTKEGVPFCGMRFYPGLRPRILGATKRRFEKRRDRLIKAREYRRLNVSTFAWYQFSREGNTEGLRQAWSRPGKDGAG